MVFGDINNLTTILNLEPCAVGEKEPKFNDDDNASDQSYLTKDDDSTLSGDHDLPMHHMEDNPDDYYKDPGVGAENGDEQGVWEEVAVGNNDNDAKDDDTLLEELHVVEDLVEDLVEEDEVVEEYVIEEFEEEQEQAALEPEPEADPPTKESNNGLDDGLDGKYWTGFCLSVCY
jgi:hypothetical protein